MFNQIVTKMLLAGLLLVALSSPIATDPVPNDWSARVSDNGESLATLNGPTKYSFDESAEEIDSSLSKREAGEVTDPLDAPLVWGARIEASPLPSALGSSDVSPSSVTAAGSGSGTGSNLVVGVGVDNKQKVDWALNPVDGKKLYSSNDATEVVEPKKEETAALAPETPKQPGETNPDPYKEILPAVLTGKRRLGEGDKPVQSSVTVSDVAPTKEPEKVSSPAIAVETKGHSGGSVAPDQVTQLKAHDKTIPQHVYTEDQFPSVITIKGREYLIIPHKSNTVRPGPAQTSFAASSVGYSAPGSIHGSIVHSSFGSPLKPLSDPSEAYFPYYPSIQSNPISNGAELSQPHQSESQAGHHHHQQFFPTFSRYPGQSQFAPAFPSMPQLPSFSGFPFSAGYPVYHSSAFHSNVRRPQQAFVQPQQSPSQMVDNGVQSVFSSFFPAYGRYPSIAPTTGIENFGFYSPPSHQ